MKEWISVKEKLPPHDTEVKVKIFLLWKTWGHAWYLHNYFIRKGENITRWVTHWMPLRRIKK